MQLHREVSTAEVFEIKTLVGMNNDWYATYALVTGERDYKKINPNSELFVQLARLFDAFYLGSALYKENYKQLAPIEKKEGLITLETAFFDDSVLESLKTKFKKMGIATGRPRFDADFVMNRFKWNKYFDFVVTANDTEKEKPAPDPIIRAMELLDITKTIYIGDTISDVVAATAAKLPVLFIGPEQAITDYPNATAIPDHKTLLDILL
jgi:HAD superfamily hydrolase (TIGR01549 family)